MEDIPRRYDYGKEEYLSLSPLGTSEEERLSIPTISYKLPTWVAPVSTTVRRVEIWRRKISECSVCNMKLQQKFNIKLD